jgi:hypothetical protein
MHDQAVLSMSISEKIKPLLAGHDPSVQGAVLADLVSMYFAGHHRDIREEAMALWLCTMVELIPASEQEIVARRKQDRN